MKTRSMKKIVCAECGKLPEEISYIKSESEKLQCAPYLYVSLYEPTFNPSTNLFECDECYIQKLNKKRN